MTTLPGRRRTASTKAARATTWSVTNAISSSVTFIADQAQFTPKSVETKSERDKLMFRIRVRIDPERLRAHADKVKSGVPGVAYVKLDPQTPWPEGLQGPKG